VKIAWAAKAYWGYPLRWMKQCREVLTITPEFTDDTETYAAVVDGKLVRFTNSSGRGANCGWNISGFSPSR
jgi:hypothetical protein